MRSYVYIVECADQSYYTGWTSDLTARIAAHNAKSGAKYTRSRTPVSLVYWEEWPDRKQAQQREANIKKMSRTQKEKMINCFLSAGNR